MNNAETVVRDLLSHADVMIDGARAWDVRVHDRRLFERLLREGVLGMGESYVDEWWDCDDLAECIRRILCADLEHVVRPWRLLLPVLLAQLTNLQSRGRAAKDVPSHYDRGNVLFRAMLDTRMTYSCGYWKEADDLDAAQEAKLDLVCRKLGLRRGQRVLDIGCGWGSFMKFAAERYGVSAVGVTLSEEQTELGRELCAGLPVEIRLQDYRDLDERFDHVVSIGMFEHVGPSNYRTFMQIAERCLENDGLLLLHTIGSNTRKNATDPWTDKYIFPGGRLPVAEQIIETAKGLFIMEDWHNFGVDYARTLDAWHEKFVRNWDGQLSEHYDHRFFRMWKYFLQSCSGSFRARRNQLWQIVFSKRGVPGGYISVR